MAVLTMSMPVFSGNGFFLDARNIVMALAFLYGCPVSGSITLASGILYRLFLGGQGTVTGIASMAGSAAAGLIFHYIFFIKKKKTGIPAQWLFVLGTVLPAISIICFYFFNPKDVSVSVLGQVSGTVPVIILGTVYTRF